jgi:hypothetical protein
MIGISDAKTAGLSPSNKAGEFGAELKATPIPVVSAALFALAMDNDNGKATAASANDPVGHDAVQENLFTTGSGKTVGAQRESNQIAQLSPELVQAGTNMGKIEFERKEAEERKLEAVRDMIEAQQEAYWADREVECGGVTMTGAEWKAAASYLGTAQGRKKAKEALDKAGVPKSEQDEHIRRTRDIAERMARGEKLSAEDQAFIKANPTTFKVLTGLEKEVSQQVSAIKQQNELVSSRVSAGTTAATVGNAAVFARADKLDSDEVPEITSATAKPTEGTTENNSDTGLTASIAPLKPTYNAAANGVEAAPAIKPAVRVAVNSSAEMQGMGLDV